MRARARRESQVAITDRHVPRSDRAFVRRVIAAALRHVGRDAMPVSLLLTDDREIARIHERHLGDRSPTDVISFAIDDGAELVVNVQRARAEARRHGHSIRAELALYVVHGLLHVAGFDDRTHAQRARMRGAERAVLETLGLRIAPF